MLKQELEKGEQLGVPPRPGEIHELVIVSLVRAFSGDSGVVSKTKDYLRTMGRAVGLVGGFWVRRFGAGSRRKH